MWPFIKKSLWEEAEEQLRARLMEKGIGPRKLAAILATDGRVALRAVRTERGAEARERTAKNLRRLQEASDRLNKADSELQGS